MRAAKYKPKGFYTLEVLNAEAIKYNNRTELKNASRGYYDYALRNNLLDQLTFSPIYIPRDKKTNAPINKSFFFPKIAECIDKAKLYTSINEFKRNHPKEYTILLNERWYTTPESHFEDFKRSCYVSVKDREF